jgi:hypothetical protein
VDHKVFPDQLEQVVLCQDQLDQQVHQDQAGQQADLKDHKEPPDQQVQAEQGQLDHRVLQDRKDP